MKRKRPFTYSQFKNIYSKVPRLCVDMVVKSEKGVLLLMRTGHGWENQWHLPGGTVLYREKLTESIKRIALEELSIKVIPVKLLGYTEFFSELKERGFGYSVTIVFLVKIRSGQKIAIHKNKIEFFKKIPPKTVQEHKQFLVEKLGYK